MLLRGVRLDCSCLARGAWCWAGGARPSRANNTPHREIVPGHCRSARAVAGGTPVSSRWVTDQHAITAAAVALAAGGAVEHEPHVDVIGRLRPRCACPERPGSTP
jgi:hypothetical protein